MKKNLFISIKIAFSVIIILFLIRQIDYKLLFENVITADLQLFIISLLFWLFNLYFSYLRWRILSQRTLEITSKSLILKSFFVGISSGLVTPLRSGEYLGRALPYGKEKLVTSIAVTFFDKFLTLFLTTIFGGIVALFVYKNKLGISVQTINMIILLSIFFIILVGIFLFSSKINRKSLIKRMISTKIFDKINSKIGMIRVISNTTKLQILLLAILNKILVLLQFSVLIYAFGGSGNIFNLLMAGLLVFFAKTYFPPITIADLGVRESASIYFFGMFEISSQIAFNASISLFFFNLLLPSFIGVYFMFKKVKDA